MQEFFPQELFNSMSCHSFNMASSWNNAKRKAKDEMLLLLQTMDFSQERKYLFILGKIWCSLIILKTYQKFDNNQNTWVETNRMHWIFLDLAHYCKIAVYY